MRPVRFSGEFGDWRRLSRRLLAAGVAPESLTWQVEGAGEDLFADSPAGADEVPEKNPLRVPRELPALLEQAARFRADDRWALLYRILWRVCNGDRSAMLAGDVDGGTLHRRIKAVRREAHHMHAFLRFRERDAALGAPQFVAWHETAHDVLDLGAEHFAERMGRHTWLVATPEGAAHFDGQRLRYQRPCPTDIRAFAEGLHDGGERLWQAYYTSTFNPARLNPRVMLNHMPARFWKHLPEGPLIPDLMSRARAGQQRLAQTAAVGEQPGRQVLIAQERAQPRRPLPSSLDACRNCEIWRDATQAVPGQGPAQAAIMLVGEQPGDHEDLAGRPFIGPAGEVLARALAAAGLRREALYLTNAVKHFKWEPRGGPTGRAATRKHATPKPGEIRACHSWLDKEIREVGPRVIVALGRTALASLLEVQNPQRLRLADFAGKPFRHLDRWILVAPHPAAVLRAQDGGEALYAALVEALAEAGRLQHEQPGPTGSADA
ncbi:UdgX family uracil-DNA binding protein [Pseudomonas sp. RIT-PI-AD]|uniref:UdgX family uracil-DNA binding protein n=1 Tax=Pseudomonas sp. RIT-PI-AD TaxID=3035294 RepID=UPI0021D8C154|nr:UdgX family uracil-DNA binding protein [Pseudomonas sp. RIT-PI-AD]